MFLSSLKAPTPPTAPPPPVTYPLHQPALTPSYPPLRTANRPACYPHLTLWTVYPYLTPPSPLSPLHGQTTHPPLLRLPSLPLHTILSPFPTPITSLPTHPLPPPLHPSPTNILPTHPQLPKTHSPIPIKPHYVPSTTNPPPPPYHQTPTPSNPTLSPPTPSNPTLSLPRHQTPNFFPYPHLPPTSSTPMFPEYRVEVRRKLYDPLLLSRQCGAA